MKNPGGGYSQTLGKEWAVVQSMANEEQMDISTLPLKQSLNPLVLQNLWKENLSSS